MLSVFLSASNPLSHRHPKYLETADVEAIRDSIRAVVSVVVPRGQIVFGGHPATTPLIRLLVRGMTPERAKARHPVSEPFLQTTVSPRSVRIRGSSFH